MNKLKIKEGINLHIIPTNKFKTNLISVFLTLPLVRENVTKEAMLSAVLRRGSMEYPTSEAISIELENMYGASFDCGIEKIGDNHVLKFYLETINEEFLPQKEEILKSALNMLLSIVFNPFVEKNAFNKRYVTLEKQNLKQIIEGKIDNKARYAFERCVEEMYRGKPYGLYKFGYVEDLENIGEKDLYEFYKQIIQTAKIDIFVSGNIKNEEAQNIVSSNEQIKQLQDRYVNIVKNNENIEVSKPNIVTEKLDITQGKLVIGLTLKEQTPEDKYITLVYNTILGGGANSKLFQNVREKASLAYTTGSNYVRQKGNIFIRCGIEIKNYEKAVDIIKKQLDDMKNGQFSEEDLENAKTTIMATIDFIPDEQDTQISYYFGQELTNQIVSVEEYKEKIKNITKEQVVNIAQNVQLHTIYFLKGEEA